MKYNQIETLKALRTLFKEYDISIFGNNNEESVVVSEGVVIFAAGEVTFFSLNRQIEVINQDVT